MTATVSSLLRPAAGPRRRLSFAGVGAVLLSGSLLSGCFATAKQLEAVQTDVTKKEAWSGERLSRMEADIEALRAENEAFRQRMDALSDQMSSLGGEISTRLEEVGRSSRQSELRTGELAAGRDKDREDLLNRMNVILDELVKENARLEDRLKKLESNAVTFGKVHKVKKGETLAAIARKYGTTVDAIRQANSLSDATVIEIGQELLIPGS